MTIKRTRPHFVAIGAPHAGIGIVMSLLSTHPEVSSSIPSLQFFATDAFTKKGPAWYEAQFSHGDARMVTGECSPQYLSRSDAVSQMVRYFPDAKLIVMVRHPLHRAIAHYEQWKQSPKAKQQRLSFATFLNTHHDAQTLGLYGQQLESYFSYYSPLQIHVMVYEEFVAAPLKCMEELHQFLGIRKDFVPHALRQFAPPPDEPRHKSLLYRLKKGIKTLYKKYIEKPPLPVTPPEYQLDRYLQKEEQVILRQWYAKDAARLSRLLHRDMVVFWGLADESSSDTDFA